MNRLLTPQEAADLLCVKKGTIYQWVHQEYMPYIKMGSVLRFREEALLEWVMKKETKGRITRTVSIGLQ